MSFLGAPLRKLPIAAMGKRMIELRYERYT
jgi:hypothetical protein